MHVPRAPREPTQQKEGGEGDGKSYIGSCQKKGIDLKNLQEGRQGSGMRKTPSACVGGRGVEKQGCRSALHHPSRVLATCISKSFDLFHRKEFNSSRMAAARHYCFSH